MQELSMNVLDIAENSVKAGASLVSVLLEYLPPDELTLTISDDGSGMTEETAARVTNPFFTSRTTRKVGLGVPFLKMAAEMTGGTLRIDSRLGEGTTVTALFHTGHIDMMPLGDMGSTMSALISGNPGIDFLYMLRRNGRAFLLDSRQVKEILDGVPVESAEVALFVRAYTNEQTEQVFSDINEQSEAKS